MSDRPATRGRRFMKLAGLTAQVAGRAAVSTVKTAFLSAEAAGRERLSAHGENGRLIAETLGELKGAVMKLGQMASVAKELLPTEVVTALARLQEDAPPVPYGVVAGVVEAELGGPLETRFESFDREPLASASIGQVHRARVDGREVVVKVQYPGVEDTVDSDLTQLKFALLAGGMLRIDRFAREAFFEELRCRLHEELDYRLEAENVRIFRELYRASPDIVVPEPIASHSTERVLTLSYEPGARLGELIRTGVPAEIADRIGHTLVRLIAEQVFVHRRLHADPNPANFALRQDGALILYDFGCVKVLQDEVVRGYAQVLRAGLEEDYAALDRALVALTVRNPWGPPVPAAYYKRWRDLFGAPFEEGRQPYDFGHSTLQAEAMTMMPEFAARYLGSFSPPAELAFLHRVILGHYGTLTSLGSRVDMRSILLPHLAAFDTERST